MIIYVFNMLRSALTNLGTPQLGHVPNTNLIGSFLCSWVCDAHTQEYHDGISRHQGSCHHGEVLMSVCMHAGCPVLVSESQKPETLGGPLKQQAVPSQHTGRTSASRATLHYVTSICGASCNTSEKVRSNAAPSRFCLSLLGLMKQYTIEVVHSRVQP